MGFDIGKDVWCMCVGVCAHMHGSSVFVIIIYFIYSLFCVLLFVYPAKWVLCFQNFVHCYLITVRMYAVFSSPVQVK
jgi:hypothetical protein